VTRAEADAAVGRLVEYRPSHLRDVRGEFGVVVRSNNVVTFVRFTTYGTAQACNPADLHHVGGARS
jgi:hypothetical protein